MSHELTTTQTGLAVKTKPDLPEALKHRQLSLTTKQLIISAEGTALAQADVKTILGLFNRIVLLLGMRIDKSNAEAWNEHMDSLFTLAEWAKQQYGGTTVEEVELAYNMAIKGELDLEDVFPVLAPRYFGEVMASFRRYKAADVETMNILRTQAHLNEPEQELTKDEADQIMHEYLMAARDLVEGGGVFDDPGSALYDWLDNMKLIKFDKAKKLEFMAQAEPQERLVLAEQAADNTRHPQDRLKLKGLIGAKLKENADFKARVVSRAKFIAINEYLKTI